MTQKQKLETEIRFAVEDVDEIISNISNVGAVKIGSSHQIDRYFKMRGMELEEDVPGSEIFRLRIERTARKFKFTHKVTTEQAGQWRESEFELPYEFEGHLLSIVEAALSQTVVLEKQRETYRHIGCEICVDRIPELGAYVEIETLTETEPTRVLKECAESIGLDWASAVRDGYLTLLRKERS